MGFKIEDGTGKGVDAGVNSRNEILTHARIIDHAADQSKNFGSVFMIATGFIPLTTTGSFSGLLYIKNSSTTASLYIDSIRSGGTAVQEWLIKKAATTGTLIGDQTPATVNNANLQSARDFDGLAYVGADAKTVTDGENLDQWINDVGHFLENFHGLIILGPGDAITLEVKPSVACDVCISVLLSQESD